MRYYPKNAVGFEINEEVADILGPTILELFESWDGYAYDEELFDEIASEHGVVPMRVGLLNESRGGEVQGVSGFDNDTKYLFFDIEEQDEENWPSFLQFLENNDITLTEGSWSQLS